MKQYAFIKALERHRKRRMMWVRDRMWAKSRIIKDKIMKDFTKGDLRCPQCEGTFARETMIHGKPAHKIIQGKVFVKK